MIPPMFQCIVLKTTFVCIACNKSEYILLVFNMNKGFPEEHGKMSMTVIYNSFLAVQHII